MVMIWYVNLVILMFNRNKIESSDYKIVFLFGLLDKFYGWIVRIIGMCINNFCRIMVLFL